MKTIIQWILKLVLGFGLRRRYRIKYVGLENLTKEHLSKPGGTLFIPSHPTVTVDPLMVLLPIYKKFKVRPLVTEYMYIKPFVYWLMQLVEALPVPDFDLASNTAKIKRSEKTFNTVKEELRNGRSFVIYPSGRSKQTGLEVIAGRSGVHNVLENVPEANVVLVRTTGLWGSYFSRAALGRPPAFSDSVWFSIKTILKNLIFFVPKRDVTIEFVPAPKDFPFGASRGELNRYLERWYNTPAGADPDNTPIAAEPLKLVSYSFWKEDLLEIQHSGEELEETVDLDLIPVETKTQVYQKLAHMAKVDPCSLRPEQDLAADLALDSLDAVELVVWMEDVFQVSGVSPNDLTTVSRVLGLASGQIEPSGGADSSAEIVSYWTDQGDRPEAHISEGELIPEVFLRTCDRLGNLEAVVDGRSGVLTYKQLKLRAILLADKIRHLPGDRIGVLLPASVGATLITLACQLAGKVPVMINWTQGARHLDTVVKVSGIQVTLTAWSFVDRLENVDLTGIDDQLVMLEELRHQFSIWDKLKAALRSRRGHKAILRSFGLTEASPEVPAVILFTSGTERAPKGVPLSHRNILSNLRSGITCVDLKKDDVVFSMLPPFHSFGCMVTGLMPLLGGVRIAYSPNPTDAQQLSVDIGKWNATVVAGAPAFLKGLLKAATPEQMAHVRLMVSGAEKAPPELFERITRLGHHVQVMEGYGITECSPMLTVTRSGEPMRGVGTPIPGVDMIIVHPETLTPLEVGERGLIIVRGDNIFSGYMSLEPLPSPFVNVNSHTWYSTGDLGFIDTHGCLSISGRLKRFVKVGGEMISLTALEMALLEAAPSKGWPLAEDAPSLAVCAVEDPMGKSEFHLFSTFSIPTEEVNLTLREAGFSNLAKISQVHQMQQIPIMGTGKIAYRQLEKQLEPEATA